MEQYKKVVITRIFLLSILVLFAVGLSIYDVFGASAKVRTNEIFEFQCGATAALGILALFQVIRYKKALRNEKELQIQYNKENDERMKAIRARAGMPLVLMTSIAMIVAGIIIGYSNMAVFCTLMIAAALQLVVAGITKLIYMKIL